MATARAIDSTRDASTHVGESRMRSRTFQRAYAIFRISLGMDIFMHGFMRILSGRAAWVLQTEKPFATTIIPMPVVHYFLSVLPYLEFIIGTLLIIGLFTMEASVAGSLVMIILIFGTGARQEWANVGNQMVYAAWYFLLMAFHENDWLSLDGLRARSR